MFGRIFLGDETTWNSLIILATYLHIECISLKVVIWRPFSGQSAICVIRRNEVGPPYLHPQLRQTVDWWIKSIGTHLQMCGELSLLIRSARQRPVGQWMAFNGPGDAGVAFSIFRRKKKKKRKSNCSLIGRRLLTNGDVQTLIEKNPLKKVRLLRIKGHETLTASALSTLIGGWFIASRWAIQSAPSGSLVNTSCWLDWQLDTFGTSSKLRT